MAIPCESCGQPVHEQVVVCPHCAASTGVSIDHAARIEIMAMLALPDRPSRLAPLDAAIAASVEAIAAALTKDDAPSTDLPHAVAVQRRSLKP